MLQTADTFDILLFRCKSLGGRLQRNFINTKWDHVAMCVKFDTEENEVFIFEATGRLGVHFKRFTQSMVYLGDFYEEIAIR